MCAGQLSQQHLPQPNHQGGQGLHHRAHAAGVQGRAVWLLFCVNDNVSIIINHAVALFCYCSIEVIFSVLSVVFATLLG